MSYLDPLPTYDDLFREFKNLLDRALYGAALPSSFATLDITVMLALLEVSYAVHQKRSTERHVRHACTVFAEYAARQDVSPPSSAPQDVKLAT